MPHVLPNNKPAPKVLVTGASGFIATWIVKTLLEQGYHVRGTVRDSNKGEYLRNLFGDKFEYVVIDDIGKDGAFDEAVKGMDAVVHTASPVPRGPMSLDELVRPAIKGTTGILESIFKYSPTVKRVVQTSSMGAVVQLKDVPPKYTEDMWNELSVKIVEEQGKDAPLVHVYWASKVLAERGAWDFMKEHEGKLNFDLVTLQPPMVYGPIIQSVPTLSALNTSSVEIYQALKGHSSVVTHSPENWIDVRDLADAHVRALAVPEAAGNRFIVGGHYDMQDFLDAIHAPPSEPIFASVAKGTPGTGKNRQYMANLDTTKAREILGIKFRTVQESAKDIARSLLEVSEKEKW